MDIWLGTFRDYLGLVMTQPSLAQRAHARLYNMIKGTGMQVDDEGKEHYAFFEEDLFGIDEPLARVVEYFKAAALGSDVGRRVLLLYGPPSSGKSQLVMLLKRGLELYTQTDEGAVYAIADCPQHEDPALSCRKWPTIYSASNIWTGLTRSSTASTRTIH